MKFLGTLREIHLKHLHINIQLSCKRNVPYSTNLTTCQGKHITFSERASSCICDRSIPPQHSVPKLKLRGSAVKLNLASYCGEAFQH